MSPETAAHDDSGKPTRVPRLIELLTDAGEIRDLLESYGVVDSTTTPDRAKATLSTLLDGVGEEALLRACFALAGDFARMASDVIDLFRGFGVTGQVQLNTANLDLPPSGLDSSWAVSGTGLLPDDVELRAQSIAAAIEGAAARLDPEALLAEETTEEVTHLGSQLRDNPYTSPIWRSISGATRSVHHERASENDLRLLRAAANDSIVEHPLLRFAPAISAALENWQQRCLRIIKVLERTELAPDDASPLVVAVSNDIQLLASQARQLVEETADAERVEGGFREFLRTDFWFQRWRVYELWVLARVLGILRQTGGEVRVLRSETGVWKLRYGRDSSPVASAMFPRGRVDVLYQYFEKDLDTADMPDIALRDGSGDYIAVIDPKHGRSYRRAKVDQMVHRYSQHFRAALTAIVNYYPMPSYPFVDQHLGSRRTLLVSDVAPGSIGLKRLELNLEDLLLSRNLVGRTVPASGPAPKPLLSPPRTGVLFYLADVAREVDEPVGAWTVTERGGAAPVPAAEKHIPRDAELLDSSPIGDSCIVGASGKWSLLRVGKPPKRIRALDGKTKSYGMQPPGWNPQATHYAACLSGHLFIIDQAGEVTDCLLTAKGETVDTIGWTTSGQSILVELRENRKHVFRRVQVPELLTVEYPPVVGLISYGLDYTGGVYPLGGSDGTLLRTSGGQSLCLSADERRLTILNVPDAVVGVSPSGRYRVSEGPHSLHREDGVDLLKVSSSDPSTVLPLLRFTGALSSRLRWSPDESRFAFLTRRDGEDAYRLMFARPGDRHATPASLPEQIESESTCFAWLSTALVRQLSRETLDEPNIA